MTVVDGVCPLMTDPDSWDSWIEGGVDIAVPTVANWEGPAETRELLDQWGRWLTEDDRVIGIGEPSDFDQFPVAGEAGCGDPFPEHPPDGR